VLDISAVADIVPNTLPSSKPGRIRQNTNSFNASALEWLHFDCDGEIRNPFSIRECFPEQIPRL
jgi:hypothetical protein